jgi:hypothetical protein
MRLDTTAAVAEDESDHKSDKLALPKAKTKRKGGHSRSSSRKVSKDASASVLDPSQVAAALEEEVPRCSLTRVCSS